ncbi:MAG: flavodoxin [Treponema sp.]|uniref:flavodoxin n=1 Tax=Treponema sp. TaxID=166 RepID=UPI0025EC84F1|nr:flavodoxin [Treponema sp.]MBQ9281133.1 flavodoxin [Treponema sp.]
MKIKSLFLAALVGFLTLSTASAKSLVVYFSHTGENYAVGNISEGNTAIIAKMIAEKTGSDIFEIIPEKDYPASYKACTDVAKDEQKQKARPAYKEEVDTSGYDTIYIGYPIWWGDLPMVVYTFLEKHDLGGKTILPFCTQEGSGVSGTDGKIKRLYKNATVKQALAVRGATAQNEREEAEKVVDEWVKKSGK